MPSKQDHLQKAASNAELAADLAARRRHPDWAVVALFYQVLHLFEAHFAEEDVHNGSHSARDRRVALAFPGLSRDYVRLSVLARNARYGTPAEVGWPQYEAAESHIVRIDEHLRPLL